MTLPVALTEAGWPIPKSYFVTPRWIVRVLVGDVLARTHDWISAPDEAACIGYLRAAYGYHDGVRFEVMPVEAM